MAKVRGFHAAFMMSDEYRTVVRLAAMGKTILKTDSPLECETHVCAFNKYGLCLFHVIEGEPPVITDSAGCLSGILKSGI